MAPKRFSIKNPFTRAHRAPAPVDRLPPELLQRTATFLSHHDRFVAALVSSSWRSILLHHPLLWCKVSICPRTRGDMRYVVAVLNELFRRSQQLPLTVELSLRAADIAHIDAVNIEPQHGAFKRAIPFALIPQMRRIKSLSLQLHEWSGTRWEDVLRTPAPILEQFRFLITCGDDDVPLMDNLFNNDAPRLREVVLDDVAFPLNPGPALRGVRSFFFDFAHDLGEPQIRHIASWRNLRDLTIGAYDGIGDADQYLRNAPLRRLQMWPFCDAQTVINTFHDVQHICLSAKVLNSTEVAGPVNPQLLVTVIRAKSAETQSVEIGYREQLLPDIARVDKGEAPWEELFAVRLDGHDAVVDLSFPDLGRVLLTLPVASLFRSLRRLAVPQPLFPLFDVADLPPLEVLTLYLGPLSPNVPRPAPIMEQRAHRVSILRVARVLPFPEDRRPRSPIPAQHIVNFVHAKLARGPGGLLRIVLDGFIVASMQEVHALQATAPQLLVLDSCGSGWLEDDDCGPWKWWFPTEDALRI